MKSGATVATDHLAGLRRFMGDRAPGDQGAHRETVARLVYGGGTRQRRSDVDVLPWREVQEVAW